MAPPKKSKPVESEGEEFSDVDSSKFDSSGEEDEMIANDTLTWVCPTVGPQARRSEFETVGDRFRLIYSKL